MKSSLNSLSPCSSSSSWHSSTPSYTLISPKCFHHHPFTVGISCALRRRHLRRRRHHQFKPEKTIITNPNSPPSDSKLQLVIDLQHYLPDNASLSFKTLLRSSELKFNQLVDSGTEAFEDLRTLITFDSDRRVVISCEKSTVHFLGNLALLGLIAVVSFRVLVKLGLGFRKLFRFRAGDGGVIRRRDRSLGGKEVVVGKREEMNKEVNRVSLNPLSSDEEILEGVSDTLVKNWPRKSVLQKLPSWWPLSHSTPFVAVDKQEYQQRANRLLRAIMDYKVSGKDIMVEDIILLRRICRESGVRVFFDATNSRDSFYRASIDFALNTCASMASQSTFVQIDGEDAREFIAGLADNIGLEKIRAARMVAAAVAARTRSWLLQAWALEMQGKHSEAVMELLKLCFIHRMFPPEEGSPEMEMVARGLENHLRLEQREYLLDMVLEVCLEESRRSLAEALGLVIPLTAPDTPKIICYLSPHLLTLSAISSSI